MGIAFVVALIALLTLSNIVAWYLVGSLWNYTQRMTGNAPTFAEMMSANLAAHAERTQRGASAETHNDTATT